MLTYTATWMDMESLMLSEINQILYCQGTFSFKESSMLHLSLCAISQGFSVPYQFLFQE